MFTPDEVLQFVKAVPFRPFRIQMASGRSYEIRHPEMVRVGTTVLMIFTFVSDSADVFDRWETVSLLLMESLAPLEAAAA